MLLKKWYKQYDHESLINNETSKAIMPKSMLRNRFFKNRREKNQKLFCKQRNKGVSILRKSKKDYFESLNEKIITDNKSFGKTFNPPCQK